MSLVEAKLRELPATDRPQLLNLARYWTDSCILYVDPAILACRDIPLLQPIGTFISIELSKKFQLGCNEILTLLTDTSISYSTKVQNTANILAAFLEPPFHMHHN